MFSYIFNNNKKIDKKYLLNNLISTFDTELIDNTDTNIVLGNSKMLIDVSRKYISILLFDDTINIAKIKDYLMENQI